MTDKVNAEVPAPVTGVVSKILVDEGTTVSIGEALCVITVEGVGDAADDAVEEGKPIEPEVALKNHRSCPWQTGADDIRRRCGVWLKNMGWIWEN